MRIHRWYPRLNAGASTGFSIPLRSLASSPKFPRLTGKCAYPGGGNRGFEPGRKAPLLDDQTGRKAPLLDDQTGRKAPLLDDRQPPGSFSFTEGRLSDADPNVVGLPRLLVTAANV